MSMENKNTSDLDLRKNKSVFDIVQLVGITSTLYTCIVFLDACIKCIIFANFLDQHACGMCAGP